MGIASLILGILAVLTAIIPCTFFLAPIPALIGFGLGIAEWVSKSKKGEPKGMGVAGTLVSLVAFVVLLGWVGFIAAQKPEDKTWKEWFEESSSGMESFEAEFEAELEEAMEEAEAELKAAEEAAEAGASATEAPAPDSAN